MTRIGSLRHPGNLRRIITKLAIAWTRIALPLSACAPGQAPQAPPPERCEPGAVDPGHLFFAENLTYVDPSPTAREGAEPDGETILYVSFDVESE
jgi:hypothetical protein